MRWTRYLPTAIGWIVVALVVGAVITTAPRTTNAVEVVLTDPPTRSSSPSSSTTTRTTTTVEQTTAPAPTTSRTITRTTTEPVITTATSAVPTTPVVVTSGTTTATEPPACSSPDLSGPITAVFDQPCAGTEVTRYPIVRVSVPQLPDAGGVGIILHTLTDSYGNPSQDYYFGAGRVSDPGLWQDVVSVGLLCEEDRTRSELQVYQFSPEGWTYFTSERPSWMDITIPADSRLLDHITITRIGQPVGPDCEEQ